MAHFHRAKYLRPKNLAMTTVIKIHTAAKILILSILMIKFCIYKTPLKKQTGP